MTMVVTLRTVANSTIVRVIRVVLTILDRVAPPVAARILADRFVATKKRQPPSREVDWLRGARRIAIEDDRVAASLISWGEVGRPTVLLMHGWEGRASQMGAFAAPLVAAGYRVVGVDAPGHGEAPGKRSSILAMGRALQLAAEAVGGAEAIVAHSGGSVAATYAVASGLRVRRLAFVAAPFDPGRFLYEAAEEWGLSQRVARRSQRLLERRLGVLWEEFDVGRLAPQRREELMVVHDRGDRIVSLTDGEAIAASWPSATLIPTEGLGHHRILRDERVVQQVTDFVIGGPRSTGAVA